MRQQQPHRILVIDDNDAIHADFRKTLAGAGLPAHQSLADTKAALFGAKLNSTPAPSTVSFAVDSAVQGQQGATMLKTAMEAGQPYAVAFVDMRMPPGWDGVETIQHLWRIDPNLQVVICTAYSDHSWDEISTKLGLTDRLLILKKPFDPIEVTQLATALSEKRLLHSAAQLKFDDLERMVSSRTNELTFAATHDKLTGLANRSWLQEELSKVVARGHADPTYHYGVLFLDFDRFKVVNDSLGHQVGDQLLHAIAQRLTSAVELPDRSNSNATKLVARFGGDEFVVLLHGMSDISEITLLADSLLRLLSQPYKLNNSAVHTTASIGITSNNVRYTDATDVLRDADTAMYHAKATGKARYVMFDRTMHNAIALRIELENDLRSAIDHNELTLYYQPIVSLESGELEGFEALLRWKHPRKGLISPGDFISCCEETGLIIPIGLWALRRACHQLQEWNLKFPGRPRLSMSVNVSPKQMNSFALVSHVREILEETGIAPNQLVLEITESAIIADIIAAKQLLLELSELGVRLHLDDFGTGYSSLSCLHQFPLDGLKIDRSFVQTLSENRAYAAVVNTIISLAKNLGMKIIAEGVETKDQLIMLQALDCSKAQGYYFGRPCEPAAAEVYIDSVLRAAA